MKLCYRGVYYEAARSTLAIQTQVRKTSPTILNYRGSQYQLNPQPIHDTALITVAEARRDFPRPVVAGQQLIYRGATYSISS